MTSASASNRTPRASSKASRLCAIGATLLLSTLLTSCASVSSVPKASPQIYQPPVLRIYAGQEIHTRDGRYLPQQDEVWHSDARFRQLEQENINLTAALAQERAR